MPKEKEYPTFEEVIQFIKRTHSLRDELLIRMLWDTAGRISEVLSIRVGDFNFKERYVKMPVLKRKKPEYKYIPLPKETIRLALLYIKHKKLKPADRLFNISRQRADQIIKNITRNKYSCHDFRHGKAIYLLHHKRANLNLVRNFLAHKDLKTTSIYLTLPKNQIIDMFKPFVEEY